MEERGQEGEEDSLREHLVSSRWNLPVGPPPPHTHTGPAEPVQGCSVRSGFPSHQAFPSSMQSCGCMSPTWSSWEQLLS